MEIFNIISGACSIIGLLVSLFTASKVVKISYNQKNISKVDNRNRGCEFNGSYAGRDSINGTGNSKQE